MTEQKVFKCRYCGNTCIGYPVCDSYECNNKENEEERKSDNQ